MDAIPAIIPARGGSVGIPDKNLQQINGETLIARCVRTCQAAELIEGIYVSTDDDLIAAAVQGTCNQENSWCPKCKARLDVDSDGHFWCPKCDANADLKRSHKSAHVLRRPAEFATETSLMQDTIRHHLENELRNPDHGAVPQRIAIVQCTAPTMTPEDIDGTIRRLIESGADMALAAARNDAIILQGGKKFVRGVGFTLHNGPLTRRQDRHAWYEIAGSVWAIDVPSFLARGRLYSERTVVYEVGRRLEIDEPSDLEFARKVLAPVQYKEYPKADFTPRIPTD